MVQLRSSNVLTGLLSLFVSFSAFAAPQPPPFIDSISWNTGKESPSLEALNGKSVVVVFFQDWCPICNKWSGQFFKQVEKAYGDDPRVTLVALKTDGGSLSDALGYLDRRTDTERWIVGVDENASYYRQATGDDKLYYFMAVAPDGSVRKIDKAGMFYGKEANKEFILASDKLRKELVEGAKPLMTLDPPLDPVLQPAIQLAEQGLFLSALNSVSKQANASHLKEDVGRFRLRIAELLGSAIVRYEKAIEDESNENRFLVYLSLRKIEEDFGRSAQGQAAGQLASKYSSSSWVRNEEAALKDYQSIMKRAARADDERSRERVAKALVKFADKYPGTYYGRLATPTKK
ncbi:redoxin domain-containing protein [Roseibacillus persicicus]|nr:redoxin domain-containing protein [Roseibacillus persicicus]